jgi:hypothetical protein
VSEWKESMESNSSQKKKTRSRHTPNSQIIEEHNFRILQIDAVCERVLDHVGWKWDIVLFEPLVAIVFDIESQIMVPCNWAFWEMQKWKEWKEGTRVNLTLWSLTKLYKS